MSDMTPERLKTWQVGPGDFDWVAIVHAETRGKARAIGAAVDGNDFTEIRVRRLPQLDGKTITNDALLEAGFPETVEGYPLDAWGYTEFCPCAECRRQMKVSPVSDAPKES